MKKTASLFLLFLSLSGYGQEIRKNTLTADLLGAVNALYAPTYSVNIGYERVLTGKISLSFSAKTGVFTWAVSDRANEKVRYKGTGVSPEVRIYPFGKKAPRGFFVGAFGTCYALTEVYTSDFREAENRGYALGGGLSMGYKFGRKRLVFEPVLGGGYGATRGVGEKHYIPDFMREFNAWALFTRAEMRLGWRF